MAGRARPLRTLADRLWAVPALAARRHLEPDPPHLQAQADASGLITWEVSVDSTMTRAHQHAAGARKGGTGNAKNQAESARPTTSWARC